jgi:molybdopterin converting factor small subunit
MKVFVEFIGRIAGKNISEWINLNDDASLKDLLEIIEKNKGVKINLDKTAIIILINGRHIHYLNGLNTKLKEMDKVVIMPPVAGG